MEFLDNQILLLRPSDISFEASIYCVYKIGIIILLKTTPSLIFQSGGRKGGLWDSKETDIWEMVIGGWGELTVSLIEEDEPCSVVWV